MDQWKVDDAHSGLTLLAFIKERLGPEFSAKQIKRAVDSGCCRLNGKGERFASKLVGRGDLVAFELPRHPIKAAIAVDDPVRILYADDAVLAYDKPSGIASDGEKLKMLIEGNYPGSMLLHRLDKETTGVLLFARTKKAAEAIEQQFRQRLVEKKYLAIVDGVVKKQRGVVDNRLGKLSSYQGQTIWGEVSSDKGLPARTEWEVVKRGNEATLIACKPLTGRTHQIRVHLNGLGHPILGDTQYGKLFKCSFKPRRFMLHASEVVFTHPETGRSISIISPLPEDFKDAINQLIGKS